jgi:hypothetical protein
MAEDDVGVVINNILFLDKDCQEYVEDKPFVWGEAREPDQKALKESLLAQGFVAYKWPSEKDKIPKAVVSLPCMSS